MRGQFRCVDVRERRVKCVQGPSLPSHAQEFVTVSRRLDDGSPDARSRFLSSYAHTSCFSTRPRAELRAARAGRSSSTIVGRRMRRHPTYAASLEHAVAHGLAFGTVLVALAACSGGSDGANASANEKANTTDPDAAATAEVPAPKPLRFVVVGDTGTGATAQFKVANAISAKCAADGCDFVQLLGDNVYESGVTSVDDPIWEEAFETPYAAIDLDFYAVLGNHDYGGEGAGNEFDKGQHEVDYTNKSTKWKMPSAYFHVVKANVEIFGLDTNMQLYGRDEDQRRDVAEWLENSTATWKIAVGHHPYMSNGPHGNAGSYDGSKRAPDNGANVKRFMDDVICGKADLYLAGHDHNRQWLNESCQGTELAISGAGSKVAALTGKNATLFSSMKLGFLYLVVDGNTLTAEFVDENANVEFTHVIEKP